jgi:hypothetical protein
VDQCPARHVPGLRLITLKGRRLCWAALAIALFASPASASEKTIPSDEIWPLLCAAVDSLPQVVDEITEAFRGLTDEEAQAWPVMRFEIDGGRYIEWARVDLVDGFPLVTITHPGEKVYAVIGEGQIMVSTDHVKPFWVVTRDEIHTLPNQYVDGWGGCPDDSLRALVRKAAATGKMDSLKDYARAHDPGKEDREAFASWVLVQSYACQMNSLLLATARAK